MAAACEGVACRALHLAGLNRQHAGKPSPSALALAVASAWAQAWVTGLGYGAWVRCADASEIGGYVETWLPGMGGVG